MREILPGVFHWIAVHPRIQIKVAYARHLDLPFDHLLFAHGLPWIGGGKQALREFVES